MTNNYFYILNTRIHAVQANEILNIVDEWQKNNDRFRYIVSTNANNVINKIESEKYSKVMSSTDLSLPDSVPFLWLGRIKGFHLPERCGILEVMEAIYKLSNKGLNYRHYFYGNTQEVLNQMKTNLVRRYPKLNIVGMYSPPFRDLTKEEDLKIINMINETNPDFLWVSLGCPKQEQWMFDHRNSLNPMIAGGSGAVFNFFSGETKRAPRWVQYSGLEWFYRLLLNPKKLANRYLVKYPKFVYLFLKHEIIGVKLK